MTGFFCFLALAIFFIFDWGVTSFGYSNLTRLIKVFFFGRVIFTPYKVVLTRKTTGGDGTQ